MCQRSRHDAARTIVFGRLSFLLRALSFRPVKNDELESARRQQGVPNASECIVLRPAKAAPERGIALLPALSQAGFDELLARPVSVLLPGHWLPVRGQPVTVREALQLDGGTGPVSYNRRVALATVGEVLATMLNRERAFAARERGWDAAAPASVMGVALALRARAAALPREALSALPDRGTLEIVLDDSTPALSLVDPNGAERRTLATLSLGSGDGAREPVFQAGDVLALPLSAPTLPSAVRAEAVLTAAALDVLHDRSHFFHARVVAALRSPAWERLLHALDGVAARAVGRAQQPGMRLAFRLVTAGLRVTGFRTYAQRRKGHDRWSRGSHLERTRELERLAGLDSADTAFVAGLAGGDSLVDAESLSYRSSAKRIEPLVGHPRVVDDATETPLFVRRVPIELVVADIAGGAEVSFRVGGSVLDAKELAGCVVSGTHLVVYVSARHEVMVAPLSPVLAELLGALAHLGATVVPHAAVPRLDEILAALPREVSLALPPSLRGEQRPARERLTLRLALDGELLEARLLVDPLGDGAALQPGAGDTIARGIGGRGRVFAERSLDAEHSLAERTAAALGLPATDAVDAFVWRVADPDTQIDVVRQAAELADTLDVEWLRGEKRAFAGRASAATLNISVASAADWLELDGGVSFDGRVIALAELLAAVRAGRRYVRVSADQFVLLEDELRARLEGVSELAVVTGKQVRAAALVAEPLVAAAGGLGAFTVDAAFGTLRERFRAASDAPDAAVPAGFVGELRTYQRDGFAWLARLAAWAPGACLADDMGLGKTLQALALLLHRAADGPALVIAPTSVGDNWAEEAARFAPSLRVTIYRGPDRAARLSALGQGDVLVASYDIATLDREALELVSFSTLIVDEAQAIKNSGTQRAMAVRSLSARFRLALTGTPIENRLGELWSLFDVLTPGLLGTPEQFRTRFAVPIERYADERRRVALSRLVAPFLLRRRKDQVAPELPPRTEIVRPVELGEDERRVYEAERLNALAALAKSGAFEGRARFAVLAAITRLRLLACDPALVLRRETGISSKTAALLEVLEEVRDGGGRALVFSEFTSYLDRVGIALGEHSIASLRLDGATPAKERARLVSAWQSGKELVFLISRKAGGTGLNLTAADWVVHLDPWWNPAVEDQATDRAHRIGQLRPVTAVRLVSQGTIEQRVLAMHGRKRTLAAGILEGTHVGAALEVDELVALLRETS
jgi:superfamily II DNA or RNA helicase